MNIFQLLIAVTLLVTVATAMEAECVFNTNSWNWLGGKVVLSEAHGTSLTIDFQLTDPSGVLNDAENAIHIHQFGLADGTDMTCGASATGGHYNPILNYGELSGKFSKFGASELTSISWESTVVSLVGEFGILGRSLVVHNASGYRVGCCNIELTDAAGYPTAGIVSPDPVEAVCARATGDDFDMMTDNTTGLFAIANPLDHAVYAYKLLTSACETTGLFGPLPLNASAITAAPFTLDGELSIIGLNGFAGRSVALSNITDGTADVCCFVVVKNAQENINDVYQPTGTTGESVDTNNTVATAATGDATAATDATGAATAVTGGATGESNNTVATGGATGESNNTAATQAETSASPESEDGSEDISASLVASLTVLLATLF